MVQQDVFLVEEFMDKYEHSIAHNLGETCVDSLSLDDLQKLTGVDIVDKLKSQKLTYGHIRGSDELKNAIASIYNEGAVSSNPINPENIVVSNGTIGANFLAFYSLVNPNDKIIVVDPTYQQLSSVPGVFSGSMENVIPWKACYENSFQPNLEELKALIDQHHPTLLVINNPNNPTGAVWADEVLELIVEICRPLRIKILCDEVYRPLYHSVAVPPRSIVDFNYDLAVSTSSSSKAFSLAGIRVGWVVTRNKALLEDLWKKRDYNTISVSILDDTVATLALSHYKLILKRSYDICLTNLKIIDSFIENSNGNFSWIRPTGGSTCFIKVNHDINTEELCVDLATNSGTLIVPGSVFGPQWSSFIRVGFGNNTEGIKQGLAILDERIVELKRSK